MHHHAALPRCSFFLQQAAPPLLPRRLAALAATRRDPLPFSFLQRLLQETDVLQETLHPLRHRPFLQSPPPELRAAAADASGAVFARGGSLRGCRSGSLLPGRGAPPRGRPPLSGDDARRGPSGLPPPGGPRPVEELPRPRNRRLLRGKKRRPAGSFVPRGLPRRLGGRREDTQGRGPLAAAALASPNGQRGAAGSRPRSDRLRPCPR